MPIFAMVSPDEVILHLAESKEEKLRPGSPGPFDLRACPTGTCANRNCKRPGTKMDHGLRAITSFRTGLTATRDLANPTPERLLDQALRNLELAQLSGSQEAVR